MTETRIAGVNRPATADLIKEIKMCKEEAPVVKKVMLKASKLGSRLLRNNRGLFKTLDGRRKIRAGLEAEGASDLIGIHTVTITPDMVGDKVGIFMAVEVKKPSWVKPSSQTEIQQQTFINQVNKRGGIAFFINDHEKLAESINKRLTREVKAGNNSGV